MLKRKWLRFMLVILGLSVISIIGFQKMNRVYANRLLQTSDILKNSMAQITPNEVVYYTQTAHWRTNPSIVEPPDPYHAPLKPFLTTDQVTEVWLSEDSVHSITRLDDAQKTMLSEFISRTDSIAIYDAINGFASKLTVDSTPSDAVAAQSSLDSVSWIQGVQQSNWGRLAWVVAFQPTSYTQTELSTDTNLLSNVSYAADLQFDQTQWVFEIDQASGTIVSRKWLALTQPDVISLYEEEFSQPQTLQKSDVPDRFEEFLDSNAHEILATVAQNGQLSNEESDKLMNGVASKPTQIAGAVNFSLFAPQQTFLNSFEPKFNMTRVYYAPGQQCHLYHPLAFDFDLCAGLGNSTKFEYVFSESVNYQDIQSISLLQAAKSEVVSLLQQSPPRWSSSQAVSLNIGNRDIQSWTVPKLHGDESTNAVMFELGETFVQISGVCVSMEQLIAFAQSLEPVDVTANNLRIFMPVIQK